MSEKLFTFKTMFNLSDYFYYLISFVAVAISSLLFFKKDTPIYLKAFAPFLAFDALVALLTTYLAYKSISTISIENVLTTIEFCFYIWVIKNVIINPSMKKACLILLIGLPLLVLLNVLFLQGFNNFHSITYALGCLIIIFLSIYYFFELFSTQYAVRLLMDSGFWICSALLFYYIVSFPLFVLANFMKSFPANLGNLIAIILSLMNFILYSLFCIAFLCRIQIRKLFSSS
jgi:hypothetical protein